MEPKTLVWSRASGASVAGQTKEAAVLRKGGNQKKRTTAQHFFSIAAR
ncbi:MAG: hypothetical protein IKU00_02015 [Bacteroidales bacterium]|nr:hypothetical protein [Bacteroidales bacterium]